MQWEPDVSVGSWLAPRLEGQLTASMHSVVPRGFAAYARVLHPATVRSLPGRPIPAAENWLRLPDAEQRALMEQLQTEVTTWADTAAAFGTTMHPLAQWGSITRAQNRDGAEAIAPDGRAYDAPAEGNPDPELVAAIMRRVLAASRTSHDPGAPALPGFAAIWAGWGGLLGSKHSSGRAFFTIGGDEQDATQWQHDRMLDAVITDPLNDGVRSAKWHEGILSKEISLAPQLELPDREYVVFAGDLSVFTEPDWVLHVPWRDRIAERHGFPPDAHAPAIIWPADHSWAVISEIDFDSTIVCGDQALIDAVTADPALEALPLPTDASLTWDADRVNGPSGA